MKFLLLLALLPLCYGGWRTWRRQRAEPEGIYMDQLRAVWKVKP